jgi:hypothetical protein
LELQLGYRVTNEETRERATTSETIRVEIHDAERLRDDARDAGLEDVRLVGSEGTTLLVAHAP